MALFGKKNQEEKTEKKIEEPLKDEDMEEDVDYDAGNETESLEPVKDNFYADLITLVNKYIHNKNNNEIIQEMIYVQQEINNNVIADAVVERILQENSEDAEE